MWVLPALTHDHVRARGVANLMSFPLEDPMLHCAQASPVIANGLRICQYLFHMQCFYVWILQWHRQTFVPSLQQRVADRIYTKSIHKKTQEPRFVTNAALQHRGITFCDVMYSVTCLGGFWGARIGQTWPSTCSRWGLLQRTESTRVHTVSVCISKYIYLDMLTEMVWNRVLAILSSNPCMEHVLGCVFPIHGHANSSRQLVCFYTQAPVLLFYNLNNFFFWILWSRKDFL